jgi:hypothetical protein
MVAAQAPASKFNTGAVATQALPEKAAHMFFLYKICNFEKCSETGRIVGKRQKNSRNL